MFIVCEGPDKVGKTTQAKKLVETLNEEGVQAVYTREPGGSAFSEELRKILKTTRMNNHVATFLFTAARFDHMHQFILPSINSGKVVVCDRFLDSAYAYQCFADLFTRDNDDMSAEEVANLKRLLSDIKCNYPVCQSLFDKAYVFMEIAEEHRYVCSPFTEGLMTYSSWPGISVPLALKLKQLRKEEPTARQMNKLLRLMNCIAELHHAIVKIVPDFTLFFEGAVSDEVPVYSDIYENVSIEYKKMLEFAYHWLTSYCIRPYPFCGRSFVIQNKYKRSVDSIATDVIKALRPTGVFDRRI